ncbi:hypothetical protein BJV85_003370 [Clostridium acetobutylicum]|nr:MULTISPECIES: DUF2225 domain-containing protein [Clostridium]NOW16023.1 hypothetical protein [Clostridium acetobutylicum]NRY57702.1 hypothetical protein [Clostridium acetobutylicum]NSA94447.1 hypothetical protein [Clostridium acetobutylicum]NYC95602.1 uncharacterized protein (DUF2225 family) [Clostridium acetobutylicum]OOL97935.1 hypothetical protein CLACE_18780 [Clostridium acetobutylicum]
MDSNIFSELKDLGFEDVSNIDIYGKNKKEENKMRKEEEKKTSINDLLYDKTVNCPVCNTTFKARTVKTSAIRILKKDTDFFIQYKNINPYFYDVWLCPICGYAAMKSDFEKIKSYQKELVEKNISLKWHSKKYPDIYDINIAIERFKLSLLNYVSIEAHSSKKAMNCLKIAWMYRIQQNEDMEKVFLKNALEGFDDAYYNESFPIYGMNKFSLMYLIGELHRRLGDEDKALLWFGNVITNSLAPQKLKEMARNQKDLIRENEKKLSQTQDNDSNDDDNSEATTPKKKGLFSKLFNN